MQAAPECLAWPASLAKAETLLAQAAATGTKLVVFPETWLPGYPAWLDCCRDVNLWDLPAVKQVDRRLVKNSVVVPFADLQWRG
jgi:nitrilase